MIKKLSFKLFCLLFLGGEAFTIEISKKDERYSKCIILVVIMKLLLVLKSQLVLIDRPNVVPDGAVNFAFLGQFAETQRDTIFTTEYSIRTGMEAVYTLLDIDRGVPEVWGSTYDVRDLLHATVALRDGKTITDMDLNFVEKFILKQALRKTEGTDIEKLLQKYRLI